MNSVRETIAFAIVLGACAVIVAHCTSCSAPGPHVPAYCTDERLYTAALLRCVDKAATVAESRACRADVNKTCGITETVRKGGP